MSKTKIYSCIRHKDERLNPLSATMNSFHHVFVLLWVCVVCANGMDYPHHRGSVDFPKTHNAALQRDAIREGRINVSVTRDAKTFFGTTAIANVDLPGQIRAAVKNGSERKVYLRADARSPFGDVAEIYDAVRAAGITQVTILTEQRSPTDP